MSGAALFLHLSALGLSVRAEEDAAHPTGHAIKVAGIKRLEPLARGRVRHQICAHRPQLLALLLSGSPAALAIRAEGDRYDNSPGQEAAA